MSVMYSVKFNGVELGNYIDVLQGFTPFVGASWAPSVAELDGRINGGQFRYQKYGAKYFTMPFSMEADSEVQLQEKYDALQTALNVSDPAQLIFEATDTRYCLAVPSGGLEFDQILATGEGAITWIVPDGVFHATTEKTFDAAAGDEGILEVQIQNNGSEETPVSYEITHSHENGYIGIVSEYGAIQLGSVDEVDAEEKQRSEELFRYSTAEDYNAMTNGQGILTEDFPKNGTWGSVSAEGKQWLSLSGQGSGSSWHGASKYQVLPADTQGSTEAVNFYCQAKVWYETGLVDQTGLVELVIGDEDGDHLASIHLIKKVTNANTAEAVFQVMGVEKGRVPFTPSNQGPTTKDGGQIYIRKTGQQFDFYFGGTVYPFRVPEAAEKKAHSVTIFLGQIGSGGSLITRMYFDYLFFRKDNVTYLSDIPNRYQAGDVVFIDGGKQKVYTNGIPTQDEVVGSKYFKVPSGTTTVQFYYSDFCSPPPTVQARIREVYL